MVFQEMVAYLKFVLGGNATSYQDLDDEKKTTVLIRKTKALSLQHFCGKFLRL